MSKSAARSYQLLEKIRLDIATAPKWTRVLYCESSGHVFDWEEYKIEEQDFSAHFLEFFDWTTERSMDNHFVKGLVTESDDGTMSEGGYILVETEPERVSFYMEEEPFYLDS